MRRLVFPVCALIGIQAGKRLARWPYWLQVFSVVKSFAQPPPARAETEADYLA